MKRVYISKIGKLIGGIIIFFGYIYISIFICYFPSYISGQVKLIFSLKRLHGVVLAKMHQLLQFNLGSDWHNRPIVGSLLPRVIVSIELLLIGISIGIVFGFIKGVIDSKKNNKRRSNIKLLLTIIPFSLPEVFNVALLQLFAIWLIQHGIKIFKVAGSGTINHIVLPAIALSILPACYIARVTAMSIEDCYNQDYVKTALGKGCSNARILWNHVIRSAAKIIVNSFSETVPIIVSNMILVEYMFSYKGITLYFMQSASDGDFDAMIAGILVLGILYVALNVIFKGLKILFDRKEELKVL